MVLLSFVHLEVITGPDVSPWLGREGPKEREMVS